MQIKSHFTFSKEQRNGVFFLICLIMMLQGVYFFVDFLSDEVSVNSKEFNIFRKEIDSLRQIEIENSKPKIIAFNPNYITDYKGALLGMSNEEIDRLLVFRKKNQWINSVKQFQNVTLVPDSLLQVISPYFKFPNWVTNPKPKTYSTPYYNNSPKTFDQKQDLNTATAEQLQKINGIGEVFSERIVKFRNKFVNGFIADIQLQDVYGLTPKVIEKITNQFTVKTPRKIKKLILNKTTLDELVTIQHIDYDLAHDIIEQRQLHEGYKSLDELTKVKGFPIKKIDIIKLYLTLN